MQANHPFVSICIPTYNGQEFLRQCLETCLNQTYSDYEIVVCDDCSNDNTVAIVNEFAATYPKIKLFVNSSNLGLVGNWNRCLEEAKGTWIKFVFQDDYISANCLQSFVNAIEPEVYLLVSERDFILPNNATEEEKEYYTQVVRTLKNTCNHQQAVYPAQLISKIAVQNMAMNFIAEPSLSFFHKKVLNEVGAFNHSLKQICDFEFMLRVSSRYGLKCVPEKICSFRIHPNTTTNTNVSKNHFVLKFIEPLLLSYFMLYDAQFISFRNKLSFAAYFKLWLYFRVKAFKAYSENIAGNHQHVLFEKGRSGFQQIKAAKKGNFLIRLVARYVG